METTKQPTLPRDLLQFIYEAAYIQRWNDHIRPQGFTELDKQAHKMMILYVLARYEEQDHGAKLDWQVLVEGGIFRIPPPGGADGHQTSGVPRTHAQERTPAEPVGVPGTGPADPQPAGKRFPENGCSSTWTGRTILWKNS